jgi:GNAT superfamily N-acetyltransferase
LNLHLIHDQKSYEIHRSQIDDFYLVYLEAFPDEDEREDWSDIAARICNPKSSPRTFIFFDDLYPSAGGIIADYYPQLGVVHLIYIAVKPDHRGKGIAKRLIKELLPMAISQLQSIYGFEVQAILFESNIPWLTTKDAIDPYKRLQIFEHLGAKAIPIAYTQPALTEGKKNVENLFLLSFPIDQQTQRTINTQLLIDFLFAFYQGLGINEPLKDHTFLRMQNELLKISTMNKVTLTSIAQLEKPQIRMKKAAVCVQFTLVNDDAQNNHEICPAFYSYETDLLSSHFQKRRPFQSEFDEQIGVLAIQIHFPTQYTFLSEGKYHQRMSQREVINAQLHVNRTYSLSGNTSTWSIVISNDVNDAFSELECIKLINFFGSMQEDVQMIDKIQWSTSTIAKSTFASFIGQLLLIENTQDIQILSGILQTDTAHIDFVDPSISFDWSEFYLDLKRYHERKELSEQQYERAYYNNPVFQAVNNIFCGFALGIFDFERMDFDEVSDTLIPLKANENYLLLLNRGILLCACHDDEMFSASLQSIGISPYLLIPNMVLVNNEFTLNRIDNAIEKLNSGKNKRGQIPLNELRDVRADIDHWLDDNYLPNIFQYPSEQELYEFGSAHRGLLIYKDNLENNIQTLDDLKDELIANRQENSDLMMTLLLTLLSGVQFQEMFQSFVKGDFILSWMWTIFFSLTLTGAIFYFTKLKMKK